MVLEITNWEQKVVDLEETKQTLSHSLKEIERQNNHWKTELERQTNTSNALQASLNETNQVIRSRQGLVNNLERSLDDTRKELAVFEKKSHEMQEKIVQQSRFELSLQNLQSTFGEKEDELQTWKSKYSSLEQEIASYKKLVAELSSKNTVDKEYWSTKTAELENCLRSETDEVERVTSQLQQLNENYLVQMGEIRSLRTENIGQKRSLEEKEGGDVKVKQELHQQRLDALQKERQILEERYTYDRNKFNTEVGILKNTITELENRAIRERMPAPIGETNNSTKEIVYV